VATSPRKNSVEGSARRVKKYRCRHHAWIGTPEIATERNGLIYTVTSRNVIAALNASTGEIGMPTKFAKQSIPPRGCWINTVLIPHRMETAIGETSYQFEAER
jgi:hypothetical protein